MQIVGETCPVCRERIVAAMHHLLALYAVAFSRRVWRFLDALRSGERLP